MQYPWHALHGQTLDVERALTAEGEHLYVITLADGSLTYLPVWMTEDASAGATTLSASPAGQCRRAGGAAAAGRRGA